MQECSSQALQYVIRKSINLAYEGYIMIILAQLEESRKDDNEMRLKTSIKNWQEMEPLVIKQQYHELAEKIRQEAHGLLLEMKHKKPHKQFVSQ